MNKALEHGFSRFLIFKMKELALTSVIRNIEVYNDLKSFVKDVSKKVSPNITLENFRCLFFYYFGALLTVVSLGFITKKLQTTNYKLIRCKLKIDERFKLPMKFMVGKPRFNSRLSLRASKTIMASSRILIRKKFWSARIATSRSRWKHRMTCSAFNESSRN